MKTTEKKIEKRAQKGTPAKTMNKAQTEAAEKKNGKKTSAKELTLNGHVLPASKPVEAKKVEKSEGETHVLGKSGLTRARWWLNILIENRKAKLTDGELLKKAIREFSADSIPGDSGRFGPVVRRSVYNRDRKNERRGLSMKDPEFVKYGEGSVVAKQPVGKQRKGKES